MLRLDDIGRLKDTGKVPLRYGTALPTNLLPVIFFSTSTSNGTRTPKTRTSVFVGNISLSRLLIGSRHKYFSF